MAIKGGVKTLSFCYRISKYAQNAKNYEANTGKKMSFKGAEDVGAASGTQGESAGEQGSELASQTESKSQEQ